MPLFYGIGIEPVSSVNALDKEIRSFLKFRQPRLSCEFGEPWQEVHSLRKLVGQ